MAPLGRARASALTGLVLGIGALWQPGVAAGGSEIPFRAACDLADLSAVSTALGREVTFGGSSVPLICEYRDGETPVANTTLDPELVLAFLHLATPTATVLTIADHVALTTPDNGAGSAMTAVALDDGGLLMAYVQLDAGIAEPQTASNVLAEALFASGPVTARMPAADVPAVEFLGKPCTLVTLAELKQILGKEFKVAPQQALTGGCAYQTRSVRQGIYVGVSISQVALSIMRSGNFEDLEVAGRPAVFLPDSGLLFVDAGGGKVLNVYISGVGAPTKRAVEKRKGQAVRIAEAAFARMTPAAETGPLDCALLPLEVAGEASGITFRALPSLGEGNCFLVGPNQLTAIIVLRSAAKDADAAWDQAQQTFAGLSDPTSADVAGHPGNVGPTPLGAAVAVDLDGLPDGDGQVLAILVSDFPEGTDVEALALQLAAAAIAAMSAT